MKLYHAASESNVEPQNRMFTHTGCTGFAVVLESDSDLYVALPGVSAVQRRHFLRRLMQHKLIVDFTNARHGHCP
jgi:hypothetical protein